MEIIEQGKDIVIYGVPLAVFIALAVQVAKMVWPVFEEPRRAIVLALGLGVALSACVQVASQSAVFATWFGVVMGGLLAALAAMGVYDVAHKVR